MLSIENLKKSYREPGGARLAIYGVGGRITANDWIGRRIRWLAPIGAADFDGNGTIEIAYVDRPHLAKTLRVWRYRTGTLTQIATRPGVTNHRIGEVDITRLPESARDRFRARHLGYVFQTFNLLPGFTALENVLLGMTFTGGKTDRGRAEDLLERVGLGHRFGHKPAALSVGEQQRVAVARALVSKPVLLLADEPTANIAPAHQQQIIDLLRGVCVDELVAIRLVTHSPVVADQVGRGEQLESVNRVANGPTASRSEPVT